MREIKFRAWDGEGMFLQDNIGDDFDFVLNRDGLVLLLNEQYHECGSGVAVEMWRYVEADAVFMQFTGLKDKNGVDIYEGDIVNAYGCGNYIKPIFFDKGMFMMGNKCLHAYVCVDVRVIGNIHQNKELLDNN